MSRRKVEKEREEIAGFWTRGKGTTAVGRVVKFVETENGGFWIMRAAGVIQLQPKEEGGDNGECGKGELFGVSGSYALEVLDEFVGQKVFITSGGKVNHPKKKGQKVWDLTVEVDDEDDSGTGSDAADKAFG